MNFYIFEHRRAGRLLRCYGIGPCDTFREATIAAGCIYTGQFQMGDNFKQLEATPSITDFIQLCEHHVENYGRISRFVNVN